MDRPNDGDYSTLSLAGDEFISTLKKCNLLGYKRSMIKSFKHKGLEDFFYTGKKKSIKPEHADRLERILDRLSAASEIRDLSYPGSDLHKPAGDKKDQYAVKVSRNWRAFFEFVNGHAYMVD